MTLSGWTAIGAGLVFAIVVAAIAGAIAWGRTPAGR